MKKKIFIGILVLLIGAFGAGYIYLDTILTSIVVSTLDSQYGLELKMDDVEIGATPGWVTIVKPDIYDSKSAATMQLLSANSLQLGLNLSQIFRGKVDVAEIRSSALAVYLNQQDQNPLNWSDVIPRFLPAQNLPVQTIAQTEVTQKPADAESFRTPVPPVTFEDFQIHYTSSTGDTSQSYTIAFGELQHEPSKNRLSFKNLSARSGNESMASIASAEVKNLFNEAAESPIDFEVSGVELTAQETGKQQYNLNHVMDAWMRVYDEIYALVPAAQESDANYTALPLGKMVLSNVHIQTIPQNGNTQSESAVEVSLGEMQYHFASGEVRVSSLQTQEAGEPALTIESMSLQYDLQSQSVNSVDVKGVRVDVREGKTGEFNLNRAVKRIQHLIGALIPKKPGQTAQAESSDDFAIGDINLNDALLTYHKHEGNPHSVQFDQLQYAADSGSLHLSAFQIKKDSGDAEGFVWVPKLTAVTVKENPFVEWESLFVENAKTSLLMNTEGLDISQLIADWSAAGASFSDQSQTQTAATDMKVPFQTIEIVNADIQYTDVRNEILLTHHFSPINMKWTASGNQNAVVKIDSGIQSPGKGTLAFEGTCSPVLSPLTIAGKPRIAIQNITPYESLYGAQMPVKIDQSGIRLEGDLNIDNNQLNSSFDIYLLQPAFSVSTGNLPINFEGRTVVSTLNSLKDKDGVIAFKSNKVTGDITSPEFSFGTSIGQVLTKVVLQKGLDVINLPGDIAKEGVGAIKDSAGTVGKVLDGILNFGNNKN